MRQKLVCVVALIALGAGCDGPGDAARQSTDGTSPGGAAHESVDADDAAAGPPGRANPRDSANEGIDGDDLQDAPGSRTQGAGPVAANSGPTAHAIAGAAPTGHGAGGPVPCNLADAADAVLAIIAARDFAALAALVHPDRGVRFSPYASIDPETDRHFSREALSAAGDDATVYRWGHFDGSGEPIELTVAAYFDRFVYDKNFAATRHRAVDERLGHGNSIDNVNQVYPSGRYVEYHVPGENPEYGGLDWASLRLVFVDHDGCARLVGVVHDQWTI